MEESWRGFFENPGVATTSIAPPSSKILALTMVSHGIVATGSRDGITIHAHRVIAGRYSSSNDVAMAVLETSSRETSVIRPRAPYRILRNVIDAPLWMKLAYLMCSPVLVLALPGIALVWLLALAARRAGGNRAYLVGEQTFRRRYCVLAPTLETAAAAASIPIQRALIASDVLWFAQTIPGALVLERLVAEGSISAFVRDAKRVSNELRA